MSLITLSTHAWLLSRNHLGTGADDLTIAVAVGHLQPTVFKDVLVTSIKFLTMLLIDIYTDKTMKAISMERPGSLWQLDRCTQQRNRGFWWRKSNNYVICRVLSRYLMASVLAVEHCFISSVSKDSRNVRTNDVTKRLHTWARRLGVSIILFQTRTSFPKNRSILVRKTCSRTILTR